MTRALVVRAAAFALFVLVGPLLAEPVVLVNHLGYEVDGPKRAVLQGQPGDTISACTLQDALSGQQSPLEAPRAVGPVAHWREWTYWTVDFSAFSRAGRFRIGCTTPKGEVASSVFEVRRHLLETRTLSDVLYYFKGQRASGLLDEADRHLPLEGRGGPRVDAHGGWYDASGDYGKHLSHLSFSTYFNPQQIPLTAWSLLKTTDLLERRSDPLFRQYLRRLRDEAGFGADFLVRVKAPGGSFYRSVSGPGPAKRPDDRRIGRDARGMNVKTTEGDSSAVASTGASLDQRAYETSFRAGGGMAIAALARAAVMQVPGEKSGDYLRAAEDAWAFLAANNAALTNDGGENIVDDYCALLAATELYQATRKPLYKKAADERAQHLLARLQPGPRAYWRADGKDRPFFHPADAGLPLVSLLAYVEIADETQRAAVLTAVRTSLAWELAATSDVANPFGYARQLVQTGNGARETRFFFPHDTETAPWWQGEDARLASLAFAARLAAPHFAADAELGPRLAGYAQDQLNWILGLNPFDASMLQGAGHNNPPYRFFDSFEYTNAPGGIVNGVTAGFRDPLGIDFNLPIAETGADHDWRWGEQWLPHTSWFLLAVAAGAVPPPPTPAGRVVIGYVFAKDDLIDPATIPADQLTHVNYAFADIKDGQVVEGFRRDAENFKVLTGLRQKHPNFKVLVSVGGWTWSGAFSDASLTAESRRRFVDSAVAFVRRHDLDGFDVDWEYPGLPGNGNVNRPEDKKNFSALMSELRAALDKEGAAQKRHYLLTFAAGASQSFLDHTEMDVVQGVVDYVNLMTYDFREAESEPLAGHHSNLFVNPADNEQMSADRAVRAFIAAGVPARKLVLGVPFYGRAWGGVDAQDEPLYREGKAPTERIQTHYDHLAPLVGGATGWVRKWDASAQMPYLWNAAKQIFVAYDDPESLRVKARFIRDRGLAGVMFWELYADRSGALLGTLASELRNTPARAPAR